jgi:hypothetical protein
MKYASRAYERYELVENAAELVENAQEIPFLNPLK